MIKPWPSSSANSPWQPTLPVLKKIPQSLLMMDRGCRWNALHPKNIGQQSHCQQCHRDTSFSSTSGDQNFHDLGLCWFQIQYKLTLHFLLEKRHNKERVLLNTITIPYFEWYNSDCTMVHQMHCQGSIHARENSVNIQNWCPNFREIWQGTGRPLCQCWNDSLSLWLSRTVQKVRMYWPTPQCLLHAFPILPLILPILHNSTNQATESCFGHWSDQQDPGFFCWPCWWAGCLGSFPVSKIYCLNYTGWLLHHMDQVHCPVPKCLTFSQELLDKRNSPSTLKIYVPAFAAHRVLWMVLC